jgi:hypothetical protein
MKPRNPIYLTLALVSLVYVALAHQNGWSIIETVASNTWQHSNPSTQHK